MWRRNFRVDKATKSNLLITDLSNSGEHYHWFCKKKSYLTFLLPKCIVFTQYFNFYHLLLLVLIERCDFYRANYHHWTNASVLFSFLIYLPEFLFFQNVNAFLIKDSDLYAPNGKLISNQEMVYIYLFGNKYIRNKFHFLI